MITYLLDWGAPPPLGGWKAVVFWVVCCADSRTSDDRAENGNNVTSDELRKNADLRDRQHVEGENMVSSRRVPTAY